LTQCQNGDILQMVTQCQNGDILQMVTQCQNEGVSFMNELGVNVNE